MLAARAFPPAKSSIPMRYVWGRTALPGVKMKTRILKMRSCFGKTRSRFAKTRSQFPKMRSRFPEMRSQFLQNTIRNSRNAIAFSQNAITIWENSITISQNVISFSKIEIAFPWNENEKAGRLSNFQRRIFSFLDAAHRLGRIQFNWGNMRLACALREREKPSRWPAFCF